jgi:uncharacterized protein YicC (UPF0701 family)
MTRMLAAMPAELASRASVDLATLLTVPGVVGISPDQLPRSARPVILKLVDQACETDVAMRAKEGEALHAQASRPSARRCGEKLAMISSAPPRS